MATGFPVKANYATGDVLTAANMNDLSGTVNYLQYMTPRNAVLNSAMQVWQRGTSITNINGNGYFGADRWKAASLTTGRTISQQSTNDTTNLPFIQYCSRIARDSGNTATNAITYWQNFETINTRPFSGKTVTLSFYARAGANYSAASSQLNTILRTGTGTDQDAFYTGYTGQVDAINQPTVLTTTWQRFSYTATLNSNVTELAIGFTFTPVGTAGAADYYEITGVQLELGSVANTYMPNQPTYATELAACQRYYWRAGGDAVYQAFGTGLAASTTLSKILVSLPVTLRTTPTSVDYSTLQTGDFSTDQAVTALALNASCTTKNAGYVEATVASGLTQWRPAFLSARNSTSAYIGFNAEL